MKTLTRFTRGLKAALSAEPCPHWADYLRKTAPKN